MSSARDPLLLPIKYLVSNNIISVIPKFNKQEAYTTKKMPISDREFLTDPKSRLKKSYF